MFSEPGKEDSGVLIGCETNLNSLVPSNFGQSCAAHQTRRALGTCLAFRKVLHKRKTLRRETHETCIQGCDPNGRLSGHSSCRRPQSSSSGRWADTPLPTQDAKLHRLKAKDKVTNATSPKSDFGLTNVSLISFVPSMFDSSEVQVLYAGIVYHIITF
jgi:hypothetical protein